jgi:hypothetical protein
MFLRIVHPQVKSGQHKEVARRWQEVLGARAKENPNFKHAYMASDQSGEGIVAVLLFNELPSAEQTKAMQAEMMAKMQDLAMGPPRMEDFEVLAEV